VYTGFDEIICIVSLCTFAVTFFIGTTKVVKPHRGDIVSKAVAVVISFEIHVNMDVGPTQQKLKYFDPTQTNPYTNRFEDQF